MVGEDLLSAEVYEWNYRCKGLLSSKSDTKKQRNAASITRQVRPWLFLDERENGEILIGAMDWYGITETAHLIETAWDRLRNSKFLHSGIHIRKNDFR